MWNALLSSEQPPFVLQKPHLLQRERRTGGSSVLRYWAGGGEVLGLGELLLDGNTNTFTNHNKKVNSQNT